MTKLRVGLVDARKAGTRAIRKLFGRHTPEDDKEQDTATNSPGIAATSTAIANGSQSTGENSIDGPSSDTSTPAVTSDDDEGARATATTTTTTPTTTATTTTTTTATTITANGQNTGSPQNGLTSALNMADISTKTPTQASSACANGQKLHDHNTINDSHMATTRANTQQLHQRVQSPSMAAMNERQHASAAAAAAAATVAARPLFANKENQPPHTRQEDARIAQALNKLSLEGKATPGPESNPLEADDNGDPIQYMPLDPALEEERRMHLVFIEEALDMVTNTCDYTSKLHALIMKQARLALRINETPVGCVLVHDNKVIARGMNATNVTRNGTRHAEFMALCALFSHSPSNAPKTTSLRPKMPPRQLDDDEDDDASTTCSFLHEGNEDGSKGHLFPYGQKLHPDDRVARSIIKESILYVTVEPCVMCASLLRQLGIKKVYFGAVNDKFGGTGGVFSIHANSLPVSESGPTAAAHPVKPTMRLPDGRMILGTSYPVGGGDGGCIEDGYEIEGGWGRDDAVGLLRRFYVQENGRGKPTCT